MLDIRELQRNFSDMAKRLSARGQNLNLAPLQALLEERKALHIATDALAAQRNAFNEEMKVLAKQPEALLAKREALRALGQEFKNKEAELRKVEESLEAELLLLPNLPDASVPPGKDAQENMLVRVWGQAPTFSFKPRAHFELGEHLGLLEFERAAKVSGARFVFLRGSLAQLERALTSFMLAEHAKAGYEELSPPYIVNRQAMVGSGQFPKFEEDAFCAGKEGEYFLIPTAEVPLVNFYQDEILEAHSLPLRYCAFSPCFRAEAGSAGKDTRGLIRMHQFPKVELVEFATPETSMHALEELTRQACLILEKLGLHHRVVLLCTGDMGFASAKTYDIEVWLPGQATFREISSCSNCTDFQARRAKIRFRPAKGEKPCLVHTLNGSALAVGRTLVALMENFQREDGSIGIPEALLPFMGGQTEILPVSSWHSP
ncbi:MAG: serine--tRNA ligase [Cystobacterineae bacterium]|nr:serine--tRNA ligase [Cystobacterineae bacterium]